MSYQLPFREGQSVIELGGGDKPMFRPNVDVRQTANVDLVMNLDEPLKLNDSQFDAVFCKYAIEHLSWRKVRDFIAEVHRVLKPGGQAVFITANLLEQARMLTELPAFEDRWVCMVFGDNDYPENTHRCGFSPEFACRMFRAAGFERVMVLPHPDWGGDMIIEARKADLRQFARTDLYDKHYFHGGGRFGGYGGIGYRDHASNWVIVDHILKLNPQSVLDVGCGRGYVLKKLQDAGIPVGGLDVSRHCQLTRVINNITETDVCRTPWSITDKFFDVCFSTGFLEHVPEEELPAVFREMERVSHRGLHGVTFAARGDSGDRTKITLRDEQWWRERMPANHRVVDTEFLQRPSAGTIHDYLPAGDGKLKVNCGCFSNQFYHGWINIDQIDLSEFAKVEGYKFHCRDLRQGLPFEADTVDLAYASHFLEHLNYDDGKKFLADCRRAMRPGAVMRLAVPDAEKLTQMQKDGTLGVFDAINDGSEKAPSQAGKLWSLLFDGHQAAYDFDTLRRIAREAGFGTVERRAFREGNAQILRETMDMMPELSLYAELTK